MIEYLEGTILSSSPTHILMNVNGVGYGVHVSALTSQHYREHGAHLSIHTWMHVKEDILQLYGFYTKEEREVFLSLISISGIGPKMAQRILSEATPAQLSDIVARDDMTSLSKFKGIGKKTASLLMLHLKSSFAKMEFISQSAQSGGSASEAIMALVALGVKESSAQKAIETAVKTCGADATVQLLITEGLKKV